MKAFNIISFSMAISGCAVFNGAPESAIDVDKTIERYSTELERFANHPPQNCKDIKPLSIRLLPSWI